MQRIEFRLIYFPDTKGWRLYCGDDYIIIANDISNLHTGAISLLRSLSAGISHLANTIEDVRERN